MNEEKILLYLPKDLKDYIQKESSKLGLSMTAFIRFVICKYKENK